MRKKIIFSEEKNNYEYYEVKENLKFYVFKTYKLNIEAEK